MREPIVAGAFYPGSEQALRRQLEELFGGAVTPSSTPLAGPAGVVAPHAGYVYSGATAARAIRWLAERGTPEWVLVMGTNHTGWGAPVSVDTATAWRTPLGTVPVAENTRRLVGGAVSADPQAFTREHSLEVQLPLLQYAFGDLRMVPVCIGTHDLATLEGAVERLAGAIEGAPVAVVASSDFTHYEPQETAAHQDREAIERIVALDAEGFLRRVRERRLSICGAGAIATLLMIGRRLGWAPGTVLDYRTSGDVTGERDAVVGYAAIGWKGSGA
jgi:hypothetical protein